MSAGRCPRCRQHIIVRRVDGRPVYLTEAAVPVFDGERQREADEHRWAAERRHWLRLSRTVKAPADRRQRLERASLSAASVQSARNLYTTSADREVRAARLAKQWSVIATVRREQAAALFKDAGSPVPPPDDLLALHREAASAALRAIATVARQAELVGGTCCAACRADDGKTYRIADELRVPRLPHAGCPRGLCGCDWFVATETPRRRRRTAPSEAIADSATASTLPGGGDAPAVPAVDGVPGAVDAADVLAGPIDDPADPGPVAT